MTTAGEMLAVARSQLGIVEGPGSNNIKYNTWFYGAPVVGDNYAWCAVFVSWCAEQAGAGELFGKFAYCPTVVNRWKALGQWGSTPRIGAQVVYQWPGMGRPCHTGLVEAFTPGGAITALEGNTDVAGGRTGGRVLRVVRRANIYGYGYPAYSAAPAAAPSPPSPAPGHALAVDGDLGPATIRRLQQVVGVTADGVRGPDTNRAMQRWLNVKADGQVGPQTIRALQGRCGCATDGKWGPDTTRHLQLWLNAH